MIFCVTLSFKLSNYFFHSKQNSNSDLVGSMVLVLNQLNTEVLESWMHVDVELLACQVLVGAGGI